jgi:prolipoprotein diacylglyceryl transferase
MDTWLFLDAAGPAVLVGQGIGRIANFINQELYGPVTTLPWGIPISAQHRLPIFQNLIKYPVETTRFHPTFAYELLWNFAAAGLLLWLVQRYEKDLKPGTVFAGWLILAGIGRTWIEFFRPDQPKIGESLVSYSMLVAALMAITGVVMLLARYKVIQLAAAEEWDDEYRLSTRPVESSAVEIIAEEDEDEPKPIRKKVQTRKPAATVKKPVARAKKTTKE